MPTQMEWTMIAQDKGRKIRFLETADDYVDQLRDDRMTWRNYYQDVNERVFPEQPDSR